MPDFTHLTRLVALVFLATLTILLNACSPASGIDQAYYQGANFSPNAYTRSIFSSSNF